VVPGESTATLATSAAASAIKHAGLSAEDIDLVIVATTTPEQIIPQTAAFVHEGLGLRCGAFDVNGACAGFVYGLVVSSSLLCTAGFNHVLLVGAETLTRVVDSEDRGTAILFGDGAGAAVLSRCSDATGPALLGWDLGADGNLSELIGVPAGGSRRPSSPETLEAGLHYMKLRGQEVFRRAVRITVESSLLVLSKCGLTPSDVDLFVPHQANSRIIDAAVRRLGIDPGRAAVNVQRYGNTSAASIPLALFEAADEDRIDDGDLVLLSGFGAGMTWASALLRWGRP
ncbi:MAG: 3-oxoacyl-ACP synthase III family protein, partial [Acidimicrobiia bacterium]